MATQNVTLSKRYVLIASDTQNFFLSLPWLTGEAEALAQYQADVEAAREWGRAERAKIGL